jgi:osmotically-inducible protein OsmY
VVGFRSGSPAMDPFAERIATLLERTVQIKKLSPIRVEVRGETAILRGRVATQEDRQLAENLVRLEPGIWDVKNELTAIEAR